jgi:hypothetical protein
VTTSSLYVDIHLAAAPRHLLSPEELMSSENDVTDRLLSEARKKTAKQDSSTMGKVALIVGIIAVIASPISILGWILGAAAVGTGVIAVRRPISQKRGKIAIVLGVVAILVGVFFFTLSLTLYS